MFGVDHALKPSSWNIVDNHSPNEHPKATEHDHESHGHRPGQFNEVPQTTSHRERKDGEKQKKAKCQHDVKVFLDVTE